MKRRRLRVTHNFERNLDVIEAFDDPPSDAIVESFTQLERVTRQLTRTPAAGRPVAAPADPLVSNVIARLGGGQLRECLCGELLLLYLCSPHRVTLLAVRHHRQRGYTFA